MRNLVDKIKQFFPQIKSNHLSKIYKTYRKMNFGKDNNFDGIINTIKNDELFNMACDMSKVDCIVDNGDFAGYLKKVSLTYNIKNGFKIYDSSLCGFPEYMPLMEFPLNNENIEKVFNGNFTPDVFKFLILRYIKKMDNILTKKEDASKYKMKPLKSGFELLYDEAVKRE